MVKEARAECVADQVAKWMNAGKDWPKHATLLERLFPRDFGRNQQIQIESNSTVTYIHELGPKAESAILARREELQALKDLDTGGSEATPTPLLAEHASPPQTPD